MLDPVTKKERRCSIEKARMEMLRSQLKNMAIQPVEYIHRNALGFCEGSVIKYVSRWRAKGGVEDLKKARHFIDLLIEMEAGE